MSDNEIEDPIKCVHYGSNMKNKEQCGIFSIPCNNSHERGCYFSIADRDKMLELESLHL